MLQNNRLVTILSPSKGQLISEWILVSSNLPKSQPNFGQISALWIWLVFWEIWSIILWLSVVQQNIRVTRRIVLTHLIKAIYEFGCFKEKVWLFLKFWIWQRCYLPSCPDTNLRDLKTLSFHSEINWLLKEQSCSWKALIMKPRMKIS